MIIAQEYQRWLLNSSSKHDTFTLLAALLLSFGDKDAAQFRQRSSTHTSPDYFSLRFDERFSFGSTSRNQTNNQTQDDVSYVALFVHLRARGEVCFKKHAIVFQIPKILETETFSPPSFAEQRHSVATTAC